MERTREIVVFQLLPTHERDHLDLDTGEMFQDYVYARLLKNEEKLIDASITFRSKNDDEITGESAMHYFQERTRDFESYPSKIMFDAYLEPTLFQQILENTRKGLLPETLTITLKDERSFFTAPGEEKKEPPLGYGWEPDGIIM